MHFELRDPSGTVVNPYSSLVAAGGNDVKGSPRDPLIGGARVLEIGTYGADVRVLQQSLTDLGYAVGPIDGRFGPATDRAVRSFQATTGLIADGLVGRGTKAAIAGSQHTDASSGILSLGSRGSEVRSLQSVLNDRGFTAGSADGIFGPRTLGAVIAFQRHAKLWVDGLVGPNTKSSLGML